MPESTRKQNRADRSGSRRRRRRITWWLVAGVFVVLVGAVTAIAAIIVPKAFQARDVLTSSIPLVSEIQSSVLAGDTATAQTKAATLAENTAEAREATSDGLWRSLEWVPVAGPNLAAVRIAAEATDDLANDAVVPVAGLSLESLSPKDGGIDLAAVEGIVAQFDGISGSITDASAKIQTIDRGLLVGQVEAGVARLESALTKADELVSGAKPLITALPGMLGADGPRDVLILFQNNGEVMPGGGTIGSLAQLHIDGGRIEMVQQSSAARDEFPPATEPVIDLTPDTWEIYQPLIGRYVQSLTRTPRFDVTFDIAQEMWRLKTGVTVDAVVAVDVVALTQLLNATGPVALSDALTLDAENAIPMLLGDLYYEHTFPEVDAINQAFATLMVGKLFSGGIPIASLLESLAPSIDEGRIGIWSSRPDEQALIAGSPFDRRGPSNEAGSAEMGVYFMDATPGKMQRFMTQSVTIDGADCGAARQVDVKVDLANTVAGDAVSSLPHYVTGDGNRTPKGVIRVSAFVYAPQGFEQTGTDWGGDIETVRQLVDGDFAVTQVQILLKPGESRALTFTYTTDHQGRIGANVTPVVTPTSLTSAEACTAG